MHWSHSLLLLSRPESPPPTFGLQAHWPSVTSQTPTCPMVPGRWQSQSGKNGGGSKNDKTASKHFFLVFSTHLHILLGSIPGGSSRGVCRCRRSFPSPSLCKYKASLPERPRSRPVQRNPLSLRQGCSCTPHREGSCIYLVLSRRRKKGYHCHQCCRTYCMVFQCHSFRFTFGARTGHTWHQWSCWGKNKFRYRHRSSLGIPNCHNCKLKWRESGVKHHRFGEPPSKLSFFFEPLHWGYSKYPGEHWRHCLPPKLL